VAAIEEHHLDELVAGFEDGSWPTERWTHAAHLSTAVCYVLRDGDAALDSLRTGIPRYNELRGGKNTEDGGYHETLTCFWFEVIREFIGMLPADLTRAQVVAEVVAEFGPRRDLFREYYDFDVVKSREARARWIPPAGGIAGTLRPRPAPEQSTARA